MFADLGRSRFVAGNPGVAILAEQRGAVLVVVRSPLMHLLGNAFSQFIELVALRVASSPFLVDPFKLKQTIAAMCATVPSPLLKLSRTIPHCTC